MAFIELSMETASVAISKLELSTSIGQFGIELLSPIFSAVLFSIKTLPLV